MTPDPERWNSLWLQLNARGDGQAALKQLVKLYSQPHRAYHNLQHLQTMLTEFDSARQLCANPEAVEMAIWFHDAVYDTHAKDNEEKSAALCAEILRAALVSTEFIERVGALILTTKHASTPDAAQDSDASVLVDADLAVLGKPAEEFDRYERNIRAEYAWVSADAFRAGRTTVLRSFLDRPRIFATEHFHKLYEATARLNLANSIKALAS